MYLRKLFLNFSNAKVVYQQLQDLFPYDKLILMTNKQNWLPEYNLVYKIDQNLKVKRMEETKESQTIICSTIKIIEKRFKMKLNYLIQQHNMEIVGVIFVQDRIYQNINIMKVRIMDY
ncbi:hypothetical protein pb186bvf_004572 [Paramecium bursaria]